jgi:hypothetical protein
MREIEGPYGPPMSEEERRRLAGAKSDAEKENYDKTYGDTPYAFDTPGTDACEDDDTDQDNSD